jgi:predicted flavoprotein YhiN
VLSFFEGLGLLWVEGEGGRLFPRSMKAQDVAAVLVNELDFLKVGVRTLTEALSVSTDKGGFAVVAVKAALR